MRQHPRIALPGLVAALVLPFLAAACGGSGNDDTAAASSSSSSGGTSPLNTITCTAASSSSSSSSSGGTAVTGSATRPVLTGTQAADYTYAKVLAKTGTAGAETNDPWDPLADTCMTGTISGTANYTVDAALSANTAKSFKTIQAAINQAVVDTTASGSTARIYIEVKPGTYSELVYVPALGAPITLFSKDSNAANTKIAAAIDAGMPGNEYVTKFGAAYASMDASIKAMYDVQSVRGTSTIGTSGSAMVWTKNAGFQLKNMTLENTYNENRGTCSGTLNSAGQCPTGNHQAVAFLIDGADKVQIENSRFLGHQDTFYSKSSAAAKTVRAFVNKSHIEGDVDFIFGRATIYFNKSTIKSLGARSSSVYATAPSTNYNTTYGFVFNDCDFTSDGLGVAASGTAGTFLGRQWFEGVRASPYSPSYGASVVIDATNSSTNSPTTGDCGIASGGTTCTNPSSPAGGSVKLVTLETVGKVIILNSRIGAHVNPTTPWADWGNTTTAAAYRLAHYSSATYWTALTNAGKNPATLYPGGQKNPVEPFLAEYNTVSN